MAHALPPFRYYQNEAYQMITDENYQSVLINLFCGTGKTIIFTKYIMESEHNKIILVMPTIALITQYNQDYIEKYNIKNIRKCINICSKNEIKNDTFFTTEKDEYIDFLLTDEKCLIVCTYASYADFINNINMFNEENEYVEQIDIDCFIYDEAHHTMADRNRELIYKFNEHEDEITFESKSLFFTATPRNNDDINMLNYSTENDTIEKVFDSYYRYSMFDAIQDGYASNYSIKYGLVNNSTEHIIEYLVDTMLVTNNFHCLTFHVDICKSATEFIQAFGSKRNQKLEKIVKHSYDKLKSKYNHIVLPRQYRIELLESKTRNRVNIINDFEKAENDHMFIIASCETIGEGVDTKNCDAICFYDTKKSVYDIMQNIGRGSRPKMPRKDTIIMVPIIINDKELENMNEEEKSKHIQKSFTGERGNYSTIMYIMLALKQNDPYLYYSLLQYPNVLTEEDVKRNMNRQNRKMSKVDNVLGFNVDEDNFLEKLHEQAVKDNVCVTVLNNQDAIQEIGNVESDKNVEIFVNDKTDVEENGHVIKSKEVFLIEKKDENDKTRLKRVNKPKLEIDMIGGDFDVQWKADVNKMILDADVKKLSKEKIEEDINKIIEIKETTGKWVTKCIDRRLNNLLSDCRKHQNKNDNRYLYHRKLLKQKYGNKWFGDNEYLDNARKHLQDIYNYFKTYKQFPNHNNKDKYISFLGKLLSHCRENEKINSNQYIFYRNQLNKIFGVSWKFCKLLGIINNMYRLTKIIEMYVKDKKWPNQIDKNKEVAIIGKFFSRLRIEETKNTKYYKPLRQILTYLFGDLWKGISYQYEYEANILVNLYKNENNIIEDNNLIRKYKEAIQSIRSAEIKNSKNEYKIHRNIFKDKISADWINLNIKINNILLFPRLDFIRDDHLNDIIDYYEWFGDFLTSNYENTSNLKLLEKKWDINKCNIKYLQKLGKILGDYRSAELNNIENKRIKEREILNIKYGNLWKKHNIEYVYDIIEYYYKKGYFPYQANNKPDIKYIDVLGRLLSNIRKAERNNKDKDYELERKILSEKIPQQIWIDFKSYSSIKNIKNIYDFFIEYKVFPTKHSKNKYFRDMANLLLRCKDLTNNYYENHRNQLDILFGDRDIWFNSKIDYYNTNLTQSTLSEESNQSSQSTQSNQLTQSLKSNQSTNSSSSDQSPQSSPKPKRLTRSKKPLTVKITQSTLQDSDSKKSQPSTSKTVFSLMNQKINTQKTETTYRQFKENRNEYIKYHNEYAKARATWTEDPRLKIVKDLEKIKSKKEIFDLGCGPEAFYSTQLKHKPNLTFRNFDYVFDDNKYIEEADITQLNQIEHNSVNIAILSLSIMAYNKEEYITTAKRILEDHGVLYIIEPCKKWIDEKTKNNRLVQLLIDNQFIIKQLEDRIDENTWHKFMFVKAVIEKD